jgi:hypothetical protein
MGDTGIMKNGLAQKSQGRPNEGKLMARDVTLKAVVDKQSAASLEEWAEAEGRSSQAHNGILLCRIARLLTDSPATLEEIGLLNRAMLTSDSPSRQRVA